MTVDEIKILVDEYLKSKKLAWARTSLKNERARLNFHGPKVFDNPAELYEKLKNQMKTTSIKTTFIRLGQFFQWLVDNDKIPASKNPWKVFLREHALIFKHCYQIEQLTVSFEEARQRIMAMSEDEGGGKI